MIIVSIDTLRADHLPSYGYRGVATPAIDGFRRDAILYRNAYTHCPMTLPAHVSLLTGQLPYEHGVRNNLGYAFDGSKHETIPTALKRAGYATGAAVSAYVLRGDTGLRSIFDWYDDALTPASNVAISEVARPGDQAVSAAEQWIGGRGQSPFFFFLHVFEPHAPYAPPEPFRSRYANAYDGEIAAADAIVGRFFAKLKATGVYDRAVIILLSDHGEGLGDHGEGEHGVFLYREAIHVPLLLKLPRSSGAGKDVSRPVQLIDVFPTIAGLTGLPKKSLAGVSLLDRGGETRSIYAETMLPRVHFGWSELRSIVSDRFHYIGAPGAELYDIAADPHERNNLVAHERRTSALLNQDIETRPAGFAEPGAVDGEHAKRLAALGYIGQLRTSTASVLRDPKLHIADLEQLREGSRYEQLNDLVRAAAVYESIIADNSAFADAFIRLAIVRERQRRHEAAADAYRRAITAAPSLAADLAAPLGSLYLRLGRFDDARASAGLAMHRSPAAAHHLLGRIALATGDPRTASREAALAAEDPLWRTAADVLLARALSAVGRYSEALTALERDSSGIDVASTRGDVLARLGRFEDAESAFVKEIDAYPQNTEARTRLALLYMASGRPADGQAVLERMVASNPASQTAMLAAETSAAAGRSRAAGIWRARAALLASVERETFPRHARPNL